MSRGSLSPTQIILMAKCPKEISCIMCFTKYTVPKLPDPNFLTLSKKRTKYPEFKSSSEMPTTSGEALDDGEADTVDRRESVACDRSNSIK